MANAEAGVAAAAAAQDSDDDELPARRLLRLWSLIIAIPAALARIVVRFDVNRSTDLRGLSVVVLIHLV